MSPLSTLTRPQKAAAILVAMGKPSASRLLKFFKQEELKALIEGARLLRTIPQADLERIVAEFEAEFTEGAGLLDSADKMDTILNESLSEEEMNALMGRGEPVVKKDTSPPVWPQLEKLEAAQVSAFLVNEHPQTSAMILANLAPSYAASVVLTMDKPMRSEIIKRMMAITNMPPAAAMPGRMRRGQVDNCPSRTSRLISRPTSRKNTAIRASLIQWLTLSGPI